MRPITIVDNVDRMCEAPFYFRVDEPLNEGVRRIMRDELQAALVHVGALAEGRVDTQVHELRKTLKRLRALVRLVRSAIGDSAYRIENKALRDVARPLSQWRDSKVLLDALEDLREALPEIDTSAAFHQALDLLEKQRQLLLAEGMPLEQLKLNCAEGLRATFARVETWPEISNHWSNIRPGLKRTYRRGRKEFRQAANDRSPLLLHKWRKHVKYLRHQLELFVASPSKKLKRQIDRAAELGELLGKDHDLVILRDRLHRCVEGNGRLDFDQLLAAINDRRRHLLEQAFFIAPKLYRRSPNRFVRSAKKWRQGSAF